MFQTFEFTRGSTVDLDGKKGLWVGRCYGQAWLAPLNSTDRQLREHLLSFDRAHLKWICRASFDPDTRRMTPR